MAIEFKRSAEYLWLEFLGVLVFVAILYIVSTAPGVLWQDSGLAHIRVLTHDYIGALGLALAHPLFYMIAQAFQYLPFQESAYKTNLVSAVFGILTAANIFLLLNYILIGSTSRRLAALVGTLALVFAHTFWQHAAVAEVYSLSTFILTCQLLALMKYIYSGHVFWWLAVFFLNGLECSNHVLALITLAAILIWSISLFTSGQLKIKWLLPAAALWIIGCLPYEYLGLQAWQSGQPLYSVVQSMLYGDYKAKVLSTNLDFRMLLLSVGTIMLNFPTPNIFLIATGVFTGRKFIEGKMFNFLLLATIFHFIFAMRYPVPDQYTFFIIPAVFCAIWIGIGASWLLERGSIAMAILLVIFAVIPPAIYPLIPRNPTLVHRLFPTFGSAPIPYRDDAKYFFIPWKTGYHGPQRLAEEVFATAVPNAIIIADSTSSRPLIYYQLAKKQRTDLKILPDLYDSQPMDQKIKNLKTFLESNEVWLTRPYAGYTPDWILKNFKIVPQGSIYRVQRT